MEDLQIEGPENESNPGSSGKLMVSNNPKGDHHNQSKNGKSNKKSKRSTNSRSENVKKNEPKY